MGAMAACAFSFTAAAHADIPFGYTDSQDWDQRPYRHHNPAPRYEDPYNDYQRMQRRSDYVRRQAGKTSPGIIIGISSNSSSHVVICVNTGAKKVLSVPCCLETGVNLYLQGRNPLGISSFFIHVLV